MSQYIRKRLLLFNMTSAVFTIALGWNTLDAMMNTFYWNPWRSWHDTLWHLTPWLWIDWWICFFFLGVVPLVVGGFFLGFTFQMILSMKEGGESR